MLGAAFGRSAGMLTLKVSTLILEVEKNKVEVCDHAQPCVSKAQLLRGGRDTAPQRHH